MVKTANGTVVRLSDVATIAPGVRNSRSAGWFNREPSVLLIITKQGNANVIDTVDRIYAVLPELRQWMPAGLTISVLTDRTQTIRASVHDMQLTLGATVVLVMLVVFLFLRRAAPTIAAGVTVPLSLAGTCAAMWAAGFSIDNLSLMALAVSVGFVVDDAIVMIENMFRNLESGASPLRASLKGARQIGFTVVSISISLIAAFIPLLFMGGVVGRLFREFSVTLAFAIGVSTVVSLSVTPMICAHFVHAAPSPDATWLDRLVEGLLRRLIRFYDRTLSYVIEHRALTLMTFVATDRAHGVSLHRDAEGLFPAGRHRPDLRRHRGLDGYFVRGDGTSCSRRPWTSCSPIRRCPGSAPMSAAACSAPRSTAARLFISLKAARGAQQRPDAGGDRPAAGEAHRHPRPSRVPGAGAGLARRRPAERLAVSVHAVEPGHRTVAGLGAEGAGPGQADARHHRRHHRPRARRLAGQRRHRPRHGGPPRRAHPGHRQCAQRRLLAAADFHHLQPAQPVSRHPGGRTASTSAIPTDLSHIYVPGNGSAQVPLSAVARFNRGIAPLVVNHQGQFPATTITYNIAPDMPLETATADIQQAVAELHVPDTIHADFAGDIKAFQQASSAQLLLIVAALIAVYIVLGVLYESLAHPLTIISTLPSAGLGALLALQVFRTELTVIAFIGIILLIGIVKKNGIMMVDFALEGERQRGLSPAQAIHEACLARFRPIMMTTLAAMLGALPLVIASGPGSELRRPLGITIIGGLLVSQALTLYTTPVIYLLLDRLHRKLGGASFHALVRRGRDPDAPQPAE